SVLADSQHDPETMENHGNRPEVLEAHRSGQGAAIRHSATLNHDLCYLAMTFAYDGKPGHILRLAVPLEDVDAAIAAVRWRILGASVAAALVALIVAYFFSRSFTHRISRLRAFAEGLVDARLPAGGLAADAEDELGSLARSLDRTATQLRELVDGLSLESADNELRVTFCNQAFARAVGRSGDVPQRLPLLELVRDPDLLDMLTLVLASGKSEKRRLELASAVGRTFEVQATPLPVTPHRGAIAILYDITDLERLERVRKDFVANVSHELRTPLTAIRGYAETLLEGALEDPENNRRFLEIIKAHAIRLNNIASDLLVLSELESGKPGAELGRVSVRGALETALHTVESEARLRGVAVYCAKVEDAEVMGDKVRLEQALINLLDNAVKFNRPDGEVHVDVLRADAHVRIVIADSGIGIPSGDLSRIFERFYRVDKARSREVGGTGLGLSIVKHVVERMGGSVSVESKLGKGSTFTVVLPRIENAVSVHA
ncbi:MAG: PAS domain-containing sensor histidine kinase, partial [Acidobacteriia bacterium]|nr:PAS domain-containing sensor histidine kinase [Terriglobia bacterium]